MYLGLLRVGGDEEQRKGRKNVGGEDSMSRTRWSENRRRTKSHLTFHEYIKYTRQVLYEAFYKNYLT